MKIKFMPAKRGKKVYYFEHQSGVIQKQNRSPLRIMTGLTTALIVVGGFGVGTIKIADMHSQSKTAVSYQREGTDQAVSQKSDQSDKKLQNAPTVAREDDQLAKQIKSKLKNVPGGQKWSVYVRDLSSDRMASINADTLNNASGFANLFTVAPLETKLPAANWGYWAGGQKMQTCVENMINSADANCVKAVNQYADLKNVDAVNKGLGFTKTTITAKEQKTTAREMGDLLYRLQNGQILSDKARRTVFDGLYAHKSREGIPAKCTDKCLVANITGDSNGVRNDAAIVTVGDKQYVVVMMTADGSWSQIADVADSVKAALRP